MGELLSLDDILSGAESRDTTAGAKPAQCRLGVFGSRSLVDCRVMEIIDRHVRELDAAMIITAFEPHGVCQIAQLYARERKLPLQVHFLQADKYARGMWEHRSDHVIAHSDIVLLVHDGISRGTWNEMQRTIKFETPYIYERIPQDKTLAAIV